jgi:hypothetical protein
MPRPTTSATTANTAATVVLRAFTLFIRLIAGIHLTAVIKVFPSSSDLVRSLKADCFTSSTC